MKMVCTKKGTWTHNKHGLTVDGPVFNEIVTVSRTREVIREGEKVLLYRLAEYAHVIHPKTGRPVGYNAKYFRPIQHDKAGGCDADFLRDLFKQKELA